MSHLSRQKQFLNLVKNLAGGMDQKKIHLSETTAYIPGGHNGPYFDLETPIRNTSHWLITFSILSVIEDDEKFKETALLFSNFLMENSSYREDKIYIHRQKEGKDWSNGVIGQAWVVEALAIAGKLFKDSRISEFARECEKQLNFNSSICAWERPELKGYKNQIDYTLNHQLWYAAARAEALDGEHCEEINLFLNKLCNGAFRIRENGQICHLFYSNSLKGLLLQGRYKVSEQKNRSHVLEKEVGYHLYNLHPLARLKLFYPGHKLFRHPKLLKAIRYTISSKFLNALPDNKYAYPYNAPAFELPFVISVFEDTFNGEQSNVLEEVYERQLQFTYDNSVNLFSRSTPDSLTLSARAYEWMFLLAFKNKLF